MSAPPHEAQPARPGRALPDTQQGMRRRNLSRVMHTVSAEGPLSRAAVASRIGLTRAAVSTLVDELIRSGLLEELGPERPGRVGRPGSALAVSGQGPAGIGAEVGVDHLAVCAVDLRGRVRARAVRYGSNRGRSPEPVLEQLTGLVRQVVSQAETEGLWPAGLAVAVPGLVARDGRTVVRAPNLDWHDADLGALLPADLPPTVDNEANFGALAELWLGDGTPRDFLHVSAEIGIGAAVVFDGRLCAVPAGSPVSWGMCRSIPTGPGAPAVGAGAWNSTPVRRRSCARRAWSRGEDRVGLLAGRAAEGDEDVRRALREAGTALGIALTGAVNLLDPEAVVLGGALADSRPGCCRRCGTNWPGARRVPPARSRCPSWVRRAAARSRALRGPAVLDDPGAVAERA
uniref:Putative xylose operon regulator n=1 Tax=Streptomyces lividans TaxID=1916 RepID=Q9RFM6_STRLI|nr:putative xylose operon regulator [Streptomyces lividans TK24]